MKKIEIHPILQVPRNEVVTFKFEGKTIYGTKGLTIAAALHQSGFPVHSHSLSNRNRSLECGIGKCGACEMLVDGYIKRICITKVDGIKEVRLIPQNHLPEIKEKNNAKPVNIFKTTVVIIGAGPAGLSCREELLKQHIDNIVIDSNDKIGGQFLMQTHQFFFFERHKKLGGMRGFEIAKSLAGDNQEGIFLNSSVWNIFEGKRVAVKNILTDEIYYVDAEYIVISTGAIPSIPTFNNDDLPGVYTAAVVQKMMNQEFTLLGKNVLTIGAGNIGYLTSYQLMQAGANVKAIIEARPNEGGFPVQANRVRRLGIPILTSKMLLKAVPNDTNTGIVGAIIADCKDFKPIAGTEKLIEGIDVINICTGLTPDNLLFTKGNEVFGRRCYGAGDALQIGEGTSAVLRGRQVALEIIQDLGKKIDYEEYLNVSKEYIESQQSPARVISEPYRPGNERIEDGKPFVLIDCLSSFACNPCEFACTRGSITKLSTNTTPQIDFEKCNGCMECINHCPGLAIFGYQPKKDQIFIPIEYFVEENEEVFLVDDQGSKLGTGIVEKIIQKPNKTNIARVKSYDLHGEELMKARGFIAKKSYPEPLKMMPVDYEKEKEQYVCYCEDISAEKLIKLIGNRKFISIDEIKHITRVGTGACRGKICNSRLRSTLKENGIELTGIQTPRGPMSNQILLGELTPNPKAEKIIINNNRPQVIEVPVLIAGGGMAGSSLFRYFAEGGYNPALLNFGRGSSWRNITAGRAVFYKPEISDIARNNYEIFEELQKIGNINLHPTRFINFIHNEELYKIMDSSRAWSGGNMVEPKYFANEISPFLNQNLYKNYLAAFITPNCWQATPGLVIDLLRQIGTEKGGAIYEDCELVHIRTENNKYIALAKNHEKKFIEFHAEHFVNALGSNVEKYANQLGFETGLYPVKLQAFITRRLPKMGINGRPLDMLIDRSKHKGFTNFYCQQLLDTGQIIGCSEPISDPIETNKNIKTNTQEFVETMFEKMVNWSPRFTSIGLQAIWAGYYIEPRMIVDTEKGLLVGLQGSGFMFSQYLAKMYVDQFSGKQVPTYFSRLKLSGDGLK